jgi:hypothetical protein
MGIKEEITYPLYKKLILVIGGGLLIFLPFLTAWLVSQTTSLQSEAREVPGSKPCESPICQSSCETDKDCPWQQQCLSTPCRFCAAPLPPPISGAPISPIPTSGPVSKAPVPTPTTISTCPDKCRADTDCKWGERCVKGYYRPCNQYIKFCWTPPPIRVTGVPPPTSTPGKI